MVDRQNALRARSIHDDDRHLCGVHHRSLANVTFVFEIYDNTLPSLLMFGSLPSLLILKILLLKAYSKFALDQYFAFFGVFANYLIPLFTVRYVPDWLPLTGWKRTARRFRATVTELVEKPYAFVKSQMVRFLSLFKFL